MCAEPPAGIIPPNRTTVAPAGAVRSIAMSDLDQSYWYCLSHNRVETYEESDSPDRLGPYPTSAQAQDALKTIADRNERYDREDAEWNGDA